ncbi:TorF family putative porin [Sandaracinobacteroides saxicola]|uniref:Uncharacterized protein n=1 Tax=Sandaracinobacteroides saxicola TaxID=2759707 RepID=A0A7G5IIC7_9SPHN|nr:TorF family putative porin [Sandaracinobacteroides saxicola]QMW23119.1 hypothetical protein H3309_00960 [Sandaracinobacteroides saxicola]
MSRLLNFTAALAATTAALAATPVLAQDEAPAWAITGTAAFVSDYRFRGVSLSNKDPAVQASIQLTSKAGFFVGAWGSSIATYGGANTEVDLYGGWTGPLGPLTATIGVYSYLYPGGSGVDVYELYGSLAGTLGPVTATVGVNVAPDQKNLNRSSRYAYLNLAAAIPDTPITLKGNIGHEQGSFVVDGTGTTTKKFDYLIGADIKWRALTLGLAYIGNDLPSKNLFNTPAKDRFVVSLTASF